MTARRFLLEVVLALVATAAFLAWLLSDAGTAHTRAVVSDTVFVITPLVAAGSAWLAHRQRGGRHRAWAWIAAGCLTWAGGPLVWLGYALLLGRTAPLTSYATLGYLGYAVPIAIGVRHFPRESRRLWTRWRLALDAAVIAGSLLLTSAIWVLGPVLDGRGPTLARIVALAYPGADVVIAATVLVHCLVLPHVRRRVWLPLAAGLLVLTVTDSVYASMSFRGQFHPGGVLDVGWLVAFMLMTLAARAPQPAIPVTSSAGPGTPLSVTQQLVPYAAMVLALAAALTGAGTPQQQPLLWLAVPLALLITVRQVVVVSDHVAVERDLARAVARRTGELEHRERWWRDVVQNLSDVVLVIDPHGEVHYCSPSVAAALGHWPQLHSVEELLSVVHPDDRAAALDYLQPVVFGARRHGFAECRVRRADGGWVWFEVTAVGQIAERALEGAVLTLHDVTERRVLMEQLSHQAHHDTLTGLPNRALLMQRIDEALLRRSQQPFALLLLDLDDFKVINDRHGHSAGDAVLEVVGERLSALVRPDDTVARLGGDEFALLVRGTSAEARSVAERVRREISRPVVVGGRRFLVRTSIGIVLAGAGAETAQSLLSHADIALYEAKAKDKGTIVLIEGDERETAAKQVQLREQISEPVLEQFSVVYQPVVDLASGRMRGVEALLRWNHPELGSVPPDCFIPMAEQGGSIQVLGWHVLRQACRQLAEWRTVAPHHRLAVGVNASVRQLDEPHFADRVLELIRGHGIEPDQIVLELTEQAIAVDFETAVSVVAELRAGGVSVAVDDYGTGYSSLRYLHRFAADVVKIDRSFVANATESGHTQKIVRSVLHMAQSLDLQSIAEGIETQAQLQLVQALGCDLGQGYLFSRPVAAEEISRLLRTGHVFAAAEPVAAAV